LSISIYIKKLLSYEEYSFSWNELIANINKSEISLRRKLERLVEKREIVNLRRGFYLIIPPRYSKTGYVPIQLYVDKLFKFLDREYYLGFYSAAKIHGASHQQTQRDYIVTSPPSLLDIKKGNFDLRFSTSSDCSNINILTKKSDAGYYKISSPALTAIDLIHYQKKIGGLNRILSTLEELIEEITIEDVQNLLTWYPNKASLQRFGFFLEMYQADKKILNLIYKHISISKFFPVLLNSDTNQKAGKVNNKWKVDVNIKLESDL
jgi:predicted transcriptional regulator of viral defense system